VAADRVPGPPPSTTLVSVVVGGPRALIDFRPFFPRRLSARVRENATMTMTTATTATADN